MIVHWPFNLNFPTPRISSINIQGLSAYSVEKKGITRFNNKIELLKELAAFSDIINIQETHLRFYDKSTLKLIFPRWNIYYNDYKSNSKGTIIMISDRLLKFFTSKHNIITNGCSVCILLLMVAVYVYY